MKRRRTRRTLSVESLDNRELFAGDLLAAPSDVEVIVTQDRFFSDGTQRNDSDTDASEEANVAVIEAIDDPAATEIDEVTTPESVSFAVTVTGATLVWEADPDHAI